MLDSRGSPADAVELRAPSVIPLARARDDVLIIHLVASAAR